MFQGELFKIIQARVMDLVHDTSSNHAVKMYEISSVFKSGQNSVTDKQMDAWAKQYVSRPAREETFNYLKTKFGFIK